MYRYDHHDISCSIDHKQHYTQTQPITPTLIPPTRTSIRAMKPLSPSLTTLTLALFSIANLCIAGGLRISNTDARQLQRNDLSASVRQLGFCDSASDCAEDQVCINASGKCTDIDCDGICAETTICSCQLPCEDGQTCMETSDGKVTFTTCFPNPILEQLSTIAEPLECSENDAGQSDEICIAVSMLRGFRSSQLVFENHVLARVLCDSAGSCATKGHIVSYKGTGMMMVNYCKVVGCEQRVMLVNSPRYQRSLKVASRSDDMHFTTFAARYETSVEEAVLATAVRVGL